MNNDFISDIQQCCNEIRMLQKDLEEKRETLKKLCEAAPELKIMPGLIDKADGCWEYTAWLTAEIRDSYGKPGFLEYSVWTADGAGMDGPWAELEFKEDEVSQDELDLAEEVLDCLFDMPLSQNQNSRYQLKEKEKG